MDRMVAPAQPPNVSGIITLPLAAQAKAKHLVLVPYSRNPGFVGRSETLEQLKSLLGHGQPSTDGTPQPRVCLYGLGGIG